MTNEIESAVPVEIAPTYQAAPQRNREAPASCEAIASLVCGIVGILTSAGIILGPIAIGLGMTAKSKIKKNPVEYGGEGFATAGIILGIISVVISIVAIVLFVIVWSNFNRLGGAIIETAAQGNDPYALYDDINNFTP